MKCVGIVGGLGPETTAEFYLNLVRRFRSSSYIYPSIVIDNVSFPFHLERDIIQNSVNEGKMLPYIIKSIKRLNDSRVDFIAMPCNTIHVFIEELRRESTVPILSILDKTIESVRNNGHKKIGLLATTKTIESKLYETPLKNSGIETIIPRKKEQNKVAEIILRTLEGRALNQDRNLIEKIIKNLGDRGSEAILLGCTDLSLIVKKDIGIDILDSTEILLESVFREMMGFDKKAIKNKHR